MKKNWDRVIFSKKYSLYQNDVSKYLTLQIRYSKVDSAQTIVFALDPQTAKLFPVSKL